MTRTDAALNAVLQHIQHTLHVFLGIIASIFLLLFVIGGLWFILYKTELKHVKFVQELLGLKPKVKHTRQDPNAFTAVAHRNDAHQPAPYQPAQQSLSPSTPHPHNQIQDHNNQIRRKQVPFDRESYNL
jgi:hypothetical protein